MSCELRGFPHTIQQARSVCAFITGRKSTVAIRQLTGIAPRTVHRALARLVLMGLVERVEFWHPGGRVCYWFAMPSERWKGVIRRTFRVLVGRGRLAVKNARRCGMSEWRWLYEGPNRTDLTGPTVTTKGKRLLGVGPERRVRGDCGGSVSTEHRASVCVGEDR